MVMVSLLWPLEDLKTPDNFGYHGGGALRFWVRSLVLRDQGVGSSGVWSWLLVLASMGTVVILRRTCRALVQLPPP